MISIPIICFFAKLSTFVFINPIILAICYPCFFIFIINKSILSIFKLFTMFNFME